MEPSVFLTRPQQARSVSFISWNINGAKTKLEKGKVKEMLYEYDIISLNEVKTPLRVSLPGYGEYKSNVRGSSDRGGTVLLVKNHINQFVTNVDLTVEDQIWLQLKFAPRCLFGFCYIPPSDSQYYSHESFACIQEKIATSNTCHE